MNVTIFELERRMSLGGWYTDPMLIKGNSLSRTIDSDISVLNRLNLSARDIGEKMFSLIYQSKDTDWFRPINLGEFKIEIHRSRGLTTCPWAPDEFEYCTIDNWPASSDEFKISNRVNRITIKGLILSVHIIKEHSFFGGRGTSSRIEPRMVAKLLNLVDNE